MTNVLIISPTYTEVDRARLHAAHACYDLNQASGIAELPEALKQSIEVIAFKGHDPLRAEEMAHLPNLKLISNFGVGYDSIDVPAAHARSIAVTNTPDVLNDDVADLAVALLLSACRTMDQGTAYVRSGSWGRSGNEMALNRKMSGGRVGIVGLGRIGREIADRLAAFKMDIHYFARSEKETPGWTYHADPVALAEAVDFLVVAIVGGAETHHFVSAEMLKALGPQGIIVNIARGSVIDESAMLDALESGALGGAALDVFKNEPQIDPRFLALDNVVLQPHQGSATHETRRAMAELQLANIDAHFAGKPLLTPV